MDLTSIKTNTSKLDYCRAIKNQLIELGYDVVETNETKPWGAYYRINSNQAERFINEFFPGLSLEEASLGIADLHLSPKILIVSAGQRLSWQYHHRRAERWRFLNEGAYCKSETDEPGEPVLAEPGHVVQFERAERHRLVGLPSDYSVVAEIWQHTDADYPSDEDDIVRLEDDYSR